MLTAHANQTSLGIPLPCCPMLLSDVKQPAMRSHTTTSQKGPQSRIKHHLDLTHWSTAVLSQPESETPTHCELSLTPRTRKVHALVHPDGEHNAGGGHPGSPLPLDHLPHNTCLQGWTACKDHCPPDSGQIGFLKAV
jgi:hypothetical protein